MLKIALWAKLGKISGQNFKSTKTYYEIRQNS